MKKKLFFFLPSYLNNAGHENAFINTLIKTSQKKKIDFYFLTPKKNKTKTNNYNRFVMSSFFIFKFFDIFINYFQLLKILKNFRNNKIIIYIDGYSLYSLFCLFLLSIKIKFKPILFVRHKYKNILKKKIFEYLLDKLNKKNNKIIFLTDTIILKKYLKKFNDEIFLLPIPHTIKKYIFKNFKFSKKKISIWCPGPIRKEKYGLNFDKFLLKNDNKNFILNVNQNYIINQKLKNIKFNKLKSSLSRAQYEKQFFKNDIIILPYESENYKEKTSGIFVEGISALKITLVSDNTWMSAELKNFKLEKLIVKDWANFNLYKFIKNLDIRHIKKKLLIMKKNYSKFHNEKNFINTLSHAIK